MSEPRRESAELHEAGALTATDADVEVVSVEEQEKQISSTIEGLPDAAAILTYEY
ncbi:hypothetical protein ACI2LC_32105 [Nonomuraea wenchangensis]|uniref:Uncharacterized protein n=1 Tax=Nonomuraea wenchangensis TaxID=568860 RepID=A0A1I0KX77_9ACTN|nr:hypothetical protein [Nonomuraea wenchangensis]SEU30222.1 hypothetical protein SAMN05421811_11053 [Nonomuraea wenchangensis]